MAEDKNKIIKERILGEIEKIDKKESNIYFFIMSTHGIKDETIDYVYKMALLLKENGYNVSFIYQDEDFEPNDWLSVKEYNDIPLYDITKGEVNVGVADVLFIPEVFSSVMNQTTKLPCKRIAIIQNLAYLTKFMPISSQFGDFGIIDALTFDKEEERMIKTFFPYMRTHVAHTYVDDFFYSVDKIRDIVVNIVSRSEDVVNQIAKPFYWRYPIYKWVTFKDMRGLTMEEYADNLKVSNITIWVDEDSNNGLEALEALASGNIVIAKIPNLIPEWAKDENGELTNSIIWVNSIAEIPMLVSNLVRMTITDKIPQQVKDDIQKLMGKINKKKSSEEIVQVIENILSERKEELNNILKNIKE